MQLSRLTQGLTLEDHIGQDVEITSLTCDTRTLAPGGLFAAFRGEKTDGNQWIPAALAKGAVAVLCDHPPAEPGPWLVSPNPRAAFGQMVRPLVGRYLANGGQSGDAYLRSYGVADGLATGSAFSGRIASSFLSRTMDSMAAWWATSSCASTSKR